MLELSPQLLGTAFAGMYVVLAVLNPRGALFLIPPAMALGPEMPLGSVSVRPEDLMLVALVMGWAVRRVGEKRRGTPLDAPLVVYVLAGIAATLWGAALGTANLWSTHPWTASGFHALKRLELVLLFFVITDLLHTLDDARKLTYVFMASLAALNVYALLRFHETGHMAMGPEGTPIHEPGLAAMLNVGLALGFLVASQRFRTSLLFGGLLLGSLYVLPFSLGRNFLVSTLAMLLLVGLSRKRSLLLLLPVGWFLVPVLFPEHVAARILSLREAFADVPYSEAYGSGINLPQRFQPGLYYTSRALLQSPLLGWGLASVSLGSVDNEYALQLVTTGLLGFLVFLWIAVTLVRATRSAYRAARASNSPALPLVAGLQNCLVGYGLYSLFSPSISAARAGAFFFLLVGLVAVVHRCVNQAVPEAEPVRRVLGRPEFDPRRLEGGWSSV
ncbi:MAG: hypothetical protein QN193_10155 [Armatimonadota bacterium]|nr:hypothetical protein [Armatimonadota bacterium]MDR7570958.1 hypothetical protein [Armatimonadota bacterium]MDR7615044.1 hypothetical protein [Armatimonadota bacterium]